MKKINFKILIITLIFCLLPIIIGVSLYNKLPEQVAIHFDIENNPNNYFSKPAFVFGMPIFMALIQAFSCIIRDVTDKNKEANKKATIVFKWIIPIMTFILYVVTVEYALGKVLDIRAISMILVGATLIILGNYIPKTKGNTYIKFKEIENEKLRNKLSRIIGYGSIINGILFILSTLLAPIYSVILVILLIIEALILEVYAYVKNK